MNEPVLVIMAAGMGSRYGGLKQIDPVDEQGNLIIDYSIYDAIKAGFKKVIFIIKRELEADFKAMIGDRIENYVDIEYVYQSLDNIPMNFSIPEGREKPWGTGHAVLSCIDKINGPFAVINADDYYGRQAYTMIYEWLKSVSDNQKYRYMMVGYILENTLTENGHVARGICKVNSDGMLENINERTRIEHRMGYTAYTEDDGLSWVTIPKGSIVSMNMWGFDESILAELKSKFRQFMSKEVPMNPLKAEYFLPDLVQELLQENKATVKVLKSKDKWYGVTYRKDKKDIVEAIKKMKAQGRYPDVLWKNQDRGY